MSVRMYWLRLVARVSGARGEDISYRMDVNGVP